MPAGEISTPRVPRPERFGVIDVGSNAIRLQVVEVGEPGVPALLDRHRMPVRLGHRVFLEGPIPREGVQSAAAAVRRLREICDQYGTQQTRIIATAAVREATNRAQVVEAIEGAAGLEVEVISGDEEAYLLCCAVETRVDLSAGRSLVVDVGGGSAEVSLVESGAPVRGDSYPLGSVRLLEAATRAAAGGDLREALQRELGRYEHRVAERLGEGPIDRFVATGGSIEAIADLQASKGARERKQDVEYLSRATLDDWVERLSALSLEERMTQLGLVSDRADVILPAAVTFARLLAMSGAEGILVSRVGLRDGMLREMIDSSGAPERRRRAALAAAGVLARRTRVDPRHADSVRRHACDLFEATMGIHGLGGRERTLLEAAALLHEAGAFVSSESVHEHSARLVRGAGLVGLEADELETVALAVRYHRGPHPDAEQPDYAGLDPRMRGRVCVLAALLRMADALDRGHRDAVSRCDLRLATGEVHVTLTPTTAGDPLTLEREALREKASLFEEVFSVRLRGV